MRGDGPQHPAAGQAKSADKLRFLLVAHVRGAAAMGFAVDGDECVRLALRGTQQFVLPSQEDVLEFCRAHGGEYPLEGGFLWTL